MRDLHPGDDTDRHGTIKLIGKWLLGISAAHLLVLWILPVMVVPQLSNSPRVSLVASLARALNAGIVSGLVVLVVAGVACLLVDLLVPATGDTSAPLASSANLES
jgi:hypothetical protein